MSIKHVAVFGATGNLGPYIVKGLLDADFTVSILSRKAERPAHIPSTVTIKQVTDYKDQAAVAAALKGIDAVVSAAGTEALLLQKDLIDAAITAGVKFFIPSEFGSDTSNDKSKKLPIFGYKVAVEEFIRSRAAEGKIDYALLITGPFLDFCLEHGLLAGDLAGRSEIKVWDGGEAKISTSTMADVGKVVAGVLKRPEQFKNRNVFVNSTVVTQKHIIALAKKVADDKEARFETAPGKTDDVYADSMGKLQSGKDVGAAMFGFLYKAIFDASYGGHFQKPENEELGIKYLTEAQIEEEIIKAREVQRKQQH